MQELNTLELVQVAGGADLTTTAINAAEGAVVGLWLGSIAGMWDGTQIGGKAAGPIFGGLGGLAGLGIGAVVGGAYGAAWGAVVGPDQALCQANKFADVATTQPIVA